MALEGEDRIKLALSICEQYASGLHTIASCCVAASVPERTFYYWCDEIAEIAEAYKKAKLSCAQVFKGSLKEKARTSLEKLVEGYEYTEVKHEDVIDFETGIKLGVKTVTTHKQFAPNPTAVIFALTNTDPENFKHQSNMDVSSNGEKITGATITIVHAATD